MKKRTKITIGALSLLAGVLLLSSCTASFCSQVDKAHILYAFDYGVTDYYDAEHKEEGMLQVFPDNTNVYYKVTMPDSASSGIGKANQSAQKANIKLPTEAYYLKLDQLVLENALVKEGYSLTDTSALTLTDVVKSLDDYGYLKYCADDGTLWDNYFALQNQLRELAKNPSENKVSLDDLPSNDYLTIYKKDMTSLTNNYRSCIAIREGKYGYYGYANGASYRQDKMSVDISVKDWKYAWHAKGDGKFTLLAGLLVYPIAWLTETLVYNFAGAGMPSGLPQVLAIFIITIIVRSIMLAVTIKQTLSNAKMQALQPEITKIQNKYPNSNTNNYEKQQMAAEMQKLYKKHKINPFGALLTMVFQFPVFICVWGALQGCASLSSDALLGLHLSDAIRTALFDKLNWTAAGQFCAITALVLFLLMSAAQVVAMLLPQWIQKAKRKKVASLGKNPAQNDQQSKMKMFTYVMMAMIIFMGFTLPSAMGIYWFVGALFSIAQTFIIELINSRKAKKKGNR